MVEPRANGAGRVPRRHGRVLVGAGLAALTLSLAGCSVFATPQPAPVRDSSSLAPPGDVGYVVCPTAVTPVELATHTAEAAIHLPISGTPVLGNFAVTTSADGRWAYVVTSDGVIPSSPGSQTSVPPVTTGTTATSAASSAVTSTVAPSTPPSEVSVQNVVIPINLVTQQAERPIRIPGQGGTHAIVVMPGGRTILAASGSTIVPVDAVTHQVGAPLDLGPGRTIFGMALDPASTILYALVAGAVVPVNTANATAGLPIPTDLSVSSVYSPHGIAVTADGATVYVVGQGGADYGGRVLPITTSTGATQPTTGFDQFGTADPAAIAVTPDGSMLLVVDSADNWINPVSLATFSDPATPVRLPPQPVSASSTGTQHPTDIVLGPGRTGAFVVDGFSAVIPYDPTRQTFGRAIPVCSGASSMTVAPAP
jgi:DNA-binding beta-propeller fold protein YncE